VSWTRPQIEKLAKLQLQIQQLADEAGSDAIGVDWLVEVNECINACQGVALLQIERSEKREEAKREWQQFLSVAHAQGRM
jgi:hypothetical protein